MIINKQLMIKSYKFKNIFIVEDRNFWTACSHFCNKEMDLILCVDFGLKRQLEKGGYNVQFLDHLADSNILEELNFETHTFLSNWYKDENGVDILEYNGYEIGDSLLLYLINDVVFFCHYFFNIIAINDFEYDRLYVATDDSIIIRCLEKAGLLFSCLTIEKSPKKHNSYFFPIKKWVQEKLNPSFGFKAKNIIANIFDLTFLIIDKILVKRPAVYIQSYYPTKPIIQEIYKNNGLQVILPNYPGLKNIGRYRRIHYKNNLVSKKLADELFVNYKNKRAYKWEVFSHPISDYLQEEIELILRRYLHEALNIAQSIEQSLRNYNLKLMVPITNLWTPNRLLMHYCVKKNIPTFTIINGLLNISYYNDAKDSDFVNSYSKSIKKNYFSNNDNVFPFGDPRMDKYSQLPKKNINRAKPTIVIGSAGYDSIDLNSYIAYEFDFLYDILFCINEEISFDCDPNIIIKVRGNGYFELYSKFVFEYFPNMKIEIVQDVEFFEVIIKADLYISFYSQTIFEASCIGIPVIYYKKDSSFIHEPFDGEGELVTANNKDQLKEYIQLFYKGSPVFNEFMKKSTLEYFVGPLDGNNTQRNIQFIESILNQ